MSKFENFKNELVKRNPKFEIKYKNESTLMAIIGVILFFNRQFMTRYITTIGNTVYFPSREFMKKHESSNIEVLAHEYVHASDSNKIGSLIFSFFYLFPQSLAIFMLLLLPVSWLLGIILFFIFLAPLPAYWRMKYELRGYKMSLFVNNELAKSVGMGESARKDMLLNAANFYDKNFTGMAYYMMWPFGVHNELLKAVHNIISGDIFSEDSLYKEISDCLNAA